MFSDDELDLPYYLMHFPRVANAVVEDGPHRGFIGISVWRAPKDNQPHNARIMESIISLAFFYSTKRPWNVFHGSPEVRDRLEAALDFWCRIQSPQGAFSEYKPQGWNLAATAFATKFMGQTLNLLRAGPPIDSELLARVRAAQRKAIMFVLTDPTFYQHARNFSNQFTNVYPGALAWLSQQDDPEVRRLLEEHIVRGATELQSPVGYFYEAGGPDWGYNLSTHQSNLHGAWHYTRGTKLGRYFVEESRRFGDWLAMNVAREGDHFVLNRGIETRQQHPVVRPWEMPIAEQVPVLRAFLPSREEIARARRERRAELERTWPQVPPLRVGEFRAFEPYAFLHRSHVHWNPSDAEKRAAIAALPHVRGTTSVEQRMDSRVPVVFTAVGRPQWYAVFNSGKLIRPQQRYGLGLVWSSRTGVLLQSQSASADAAWGTRAAGAANVYEGSDLPARFFARDREIQPAVGLRSYPGGELRVEYPLGSVGKKEIVFANDAIRVTIEHSGSFTEQLPVLSPGDIESDSSARDVKSTEITIAGKQLMVVRLPATDKLSYTIRLPGR
jgi:hypothetical protein